MIGPISQAPRAARTFVAQAVVLAIVVVTGAGCPGRRDGLSRDALSVSLDVKEGQEGLPTIAEVLATRVPTIVAVAPPELSGTLAEQAFARGDEVPANDTSPDAVLLRCLRADALRNYDDIARQCSAFVAAAPADLRAAVVVGLLTRHLASFGDTTRRNLLTTLAPALAACRGSRGAGSCALLALTTTVFQESAERALGTEAAEARPMFLQHAEADGPWLDAEDQFEGSPRSGAPLRAHPRHRAWSLLADDDRLRPAADALPGWYRVSIRSEAPQEGQATLFLNADDAVEVRVDGNAVFARHGGEPAATWAWIPLSLQRGGHLIEVLFLDRGRGVAIAAVNDDGVQALTTSPKKRWAKPTGAQVRTEERGLKSLLLPASLLTGDTHSLVTLLVRHHGGLLGLGESSDDLRVTTHQLLTTFAWSPPAGVAAAIGIEQDRLPDRTLRSLAAPVWAAVEAHWPTAPLPLLARARAAADDAPEEALKAYRLLADRSPTYPVGLRELVGVLVERHLTDEAVLTADRLLALEETTENIDAALPAYRAAGAVTTVARLLDRRAGRASPVQAWQRRLQHGDTAGALRDLVGIKATIATGRAPLAQDDAPAVDDELAHAPAVIDLLEVHRPEQAQALVTHALQRHPDDFDMSLRQIRLTNDVKQARELVARTASMSAVMLAESLGVPPPWLDALAEGDAVVAARLRGAASFPSASLVALHFATERHFADDGTALVLRHWIFEARSKEALDTLGELRRGEDETLVRLRVIKPDGVILEPEHHAEVDDISLTGLAPGDLVEWLSVADEGAAQNGTFWETVSLASTTPTVIRRHVVSWPKTLEARRTVVPIVENGAAPGVLGGDGDRVSLRWEVRDVEALLDEPQSAARSDDEPQVGVMIDPDDDLYRRMRAPPWRSPRDPWLREAGAEIAGRGDQRARMLRLFRFVATRIVEAPTPADPTSTLATGRGQRLPLLWALLHSADIPVRPLAVHTLLEARLNVPSGAAFSSVVLGVDVAGHRSIIASFDEGLLLDRLPPALLGAQSIDLIDGTRGTLPDDAIDRSAVEVQVELSLGADDVLTGLAIIRLPAALADPLRPTVLAATPDQVTRFIEGVFAASFPGAAASNVTTPGLDSPGGPLAFAADLSIPVDAGGQIRFEHLFAGGAAATIRAAAPLQAFTQVADRHRTLRVAPFSERVELVLRLPSSASVVELPPPTDVRAGPFRLEQHSSVEQGVLIWERTISATGARIEPAQWPAVRAAMATLMTASDARLTCVAARPSP